MSGPEDTVRLSEARERVLAYLDAVLLPSEAQSGRNFDVGDMDTSLWSDDLRALAAVPEHVSGPSDTGLAAAVEAARYEVDAELICSCVEESGGVYVKGVSHMPCLYAHFAANIFERHLRALLSERTATRPDVAAHREHCTANACCFDIVEADRD